MATTLSKVELIYNVLSLGYSVFWVDTDVVHFANALPFLHGLDVDMAVGSEYCHTWTNFSAGSPGPFEQNTGTFYLRASQYVRGFVLDWLTIQRQHLLEWGPDQFDRHDMFQRRSDQVRMRGSTVHLHHAQSMLSVELKTCPWQLAWLSIVVVLRIQPDGMLCT